MADLTLTRIGPALASKQLDLPSICDICGNARSNRKHQKCSRIRQHRKTEKWAAVMAEKTAIRKVKERRYV